MFERIAKTLRTPAAGIVGAVFLLAAPQAAAQAGPTPIAPARFDPSDVYFQGYLASRAAEQLEANGDFVGAAEKLKRARDLFYTVHRYYPTWKPEMVTGRSAQNSEAEVRLFPKAEEQRKKNRKAVAELEGGVKSSGTLVDPAEGVLPPAPSILEVNPNETRRLAEAEAEVYSYANKAEYEDRVRYTWARPEIDPLVREVEQLTLAAWRVLNCRAIRSEYSNSSAFSAPTLTPSMPSKPIEKVSRSST